MEKRKDQIIQEVELAIKKIRDFALAKVYQMSDEDLEKEKHLMGIDLIHDACHTLRGRLPQTETVDLVAMNEAWKRI